MVLKNRLHTALYILMAAIAFMACETTVDLAIDSPPRLTIISNVSPVDGQRVYVYASQDPADTSNFYVPDNLNVDVEEIESNTTVHLNPIYENNGQYFRIPASFVKAGNSYKITAFAPGFPPVQSQTSIPNPSTLTDLLVHNVQIKPSEVHEFKKIIHYTVEFNIHHTGANRYYHVVFYNQYKNNPNVLVINDPLPDDGQIFQHHYDYGILLDKNDLQPGQPLSFDFEDWVLNDDDLERVYVELRSITAEYYKYHSTLTRQLIVRQDPFAEPVTIFNNIDGGYGNFSGFARSITSSDLPE